MANQKPKPEQDERTGRFLTGNIGGGRPKGARSKLSEDFFDALYADWLEHGAAVIARVREEKPEVFLKVVASLVPKDFNITVDEYEHLTDDELLERIRRLDIELKSVLANDDGGNDDHTTH